jgi:hypothetical protein
MFLAAERRRSRKTWTSRPGQANWEESALLLCQEGMNSALSNMVSQQAKHDAIREGRRHQLASVPPKERRPPRQRRAPWSFLRPHPAA